MAYPGTHNFNYYKGDTYEFKLYPKTNTGADFSLAGFQVAFRIASVRGAASAQQITGYAQIVNNSYILCAITPDIVLPTGTSFVYDVEIRKSQDIPYSLVYTLVTGTITVSDQITNIPVNAPLLPAGTPTNVNAVSNAQTSAVVTWAAPTTGGEVESYLLRYALSSAPTTYLGTVTKNNLANTHTFTGLTADNSYVFGVAAINDANVGDPVYIEDGATTLPLAPGVPTDFAIGTVTNSSIQISWDPPTAGGQTGYQLLLDGNPIDTATSSQTSYTFVGLTANTSYEVGILAYNTGGASSVVSQTVTTAI